MRVYATLIRVSIADALQYRVESTIYFLYEVLPPVMMLYLWLAVYQDRDDVAGFSRAEMLAYTLGAIVLRAVVTVHIEWALDWHIRQGILSIHLTRPFDLWGYFFIDSVAWKLVRLVLTLPVLLTFLLWLGPDLASITLSPGQVGALVVSITLAYVVCFFMKLCLGCVGFWSNDIQGLTTAYHVVVSVMGGVLIPVALLPAWLQAVAALLPTQAIYGVPLAILLGKLQAGDLLLALLSQVGWLLGLWLAARVLWRAGLRQYESVGG